MEDAAPGRRGRVDVFRQGSEARALRLDRGDDGEEILERAREPFLLRHRIHVAIPQLVDQPIELRTRPLRAGDVLRIDALDLGGPERVELRLEALPLDRHSRISQDHSPPFHKPAKTEGVWNGSCGAVSVRSDEGRPERSKTTVSVTGKGRSWNRAYFDASDGYPEKFPDRVNTFEI